MPKYQWTPCWKQTGHLNQEEFLETQATTECRFTLKRVYDMITTYSQMHRTDKYSQHSPIIWLVWLNGWVFVYKLSGCAFKSHCCQAIVSVISYCFPLIRSLILFHSSAYGFSVSLFLSVGKGQIFISISFFNEVFILLIRRYKGFTLLT